ncbi:MAG: hypothetical protein JWR80_5219 [Bradyrhizobium sp.]|nr:hypothetical protein [Bradyrhizobium sp.]
MASAARCRRGCRQGFGFVRPPSWVGCGWRRCRLGHEHGQGKFRCRLFPGQRRYFMPENQIQVPRDHGGLFGANGTDVVAQLEKALKPETEISTVHDQILGQFDEEERRSSARFTSHRRNAETSGVIIPTGTAATGARCRRSSRSATRFMSTVAAPRRRIGGSPPSRFTNNRPALLRAPARSLRQLWSLARSKQPAGQRLIHVVADGLETAFGGEPQRGCVAERNVSNAPVFPPYDGFS